MFNALTGLNQHTGNWPGKTVGSAQGQYRQDGQTYTLVDTPGTYSLLASSPEEEVARDFICFGPTDSVVVVVDATCLERNLNLVLQILECKRRVVVCLNLLDEAEKKQIRVDADALSQALGVPVVRAKARAGEGLEELKQQVARVVRQEEAADFLSMTYASDLEAAIEGVTAALAETETGNLPRRWLATRLLDDDPSFRQSLSHYLGFALEAVPSVAQALTAARQTLAAAGRGREQIRDGLVEAIVERAATIYQQTVALTNSRYHERDRRWDRLLTSKITGIPLMLLLLAGIFWITISGANVPSQALSTAFFWMEDHLTLWFTQWGAPAWLHGMLVLGVFRTVGWVVSVMLPPMAIFFPLFTLLEDVGYLPRIAFNMDRFFQKARAHGKQALTICMGFGCNACGVMGCRIIDSPRERLIAILTNNLVPCNGRLTPPPKGKQKCCRQLATGKRQPFTLPKEGSS